MKSKQIKNEARRICSEWVGSLPDQDGDAHMPGFVEFSFWIYVTGLCIVKQNLAWEKEFIPYTQDITLSMLRKNLD